MTTSSTSANTPAARRWFLLGHWLPWLLWMGLIFYLSDQDKTASRETSGWFLFLFEWLGMSYAEMKAYYLPGLIRKVAHLSIYLGLFLWSDRLASAYWPHDRWPWRALLWCLLYAISDEVHQIFVPGRGPHALDVVIDMLGATLGWGLSRAYKNAYISKSLDQKK